MSDGIYFLSFAVSGSVKLTVRESYEGSKKEDSLILKECRVFHDYVEEREGLNGKTSIEACGIKVDNNNTEYGAATESIQGFRTTEDFTEPNTEKQI